MPWAGSVPRGQDYVPDDLHNCDLHNCDLHAGDHTGGRELIQGVPVGRILGIPLRLDWSLGIIFWLLSWGLATGAFPDLAPGSSESTYWVAGAFTAALFLASLLTHEMSHSLVARSYGIEVDNITLWVFGGIATLRGEATEPRADFRIAIAGPLASLAIAVFCLGIAGALDLAGAPDLPITMAVWLGSINGMLAVFNLAPAAPLDGGRILRAWLWKRRGDRASAALSATRAGRFFGQVLIAAGLVQFLIGAGVGGLWLVFLGWFVMTAARGEETSVRIAHDLTGVRAGDVMTPEPVVAPATLTVAELLDDFVLQQRCSAFPLVEPDGEVSGLVTLTRLKSLSADARRTMAVRDVAWPLAQVPTATPSDPLVDLVARLGEAGDGRALVFDGTKLVGIISPTDVSRALQIAELRRRGEMRPR
ncbi:MAG: site-2 protease family protein [Acidimicrobiia bacterium]|nr:site-2 protease family protein [Acidimicrobiia bacterium]